MATVKNIFEGQKSPRNLTKFMLSRGVVDYSNLYQFDNFETGYAFLICLKIPRFLEELAIHMPDTYGLLINNYRHILEYDFKSLDGIEDITSEPNELNDGINNLNIITKVTEQSASTFSMRYYERSGSIMTKVNELYLRGIKDPRTGVKRYLGLYPDIIKETSYEYETFDFLYFVTDNTCYNIEKAYLLASCQPTSAETTMYNYTKGEIQWHELNYSMSGYPITGPAVTGAAQGFLDWINKRTVFEESRFGYNALFNYTKAYTEEQKDFDHDRDDIIYEYANPGSDIRKAQPHSNIAEPYYDKEDYN